MNRNLLYAGVGIIGVILVIVVYLLVSEDSVNVKREKEMISSSKDPTAGGDGTFGNTSVTPELQLDLYRKWAQYPPYSRPLFKGMVDMTEPFDATRPPLAVIKEPAEGCVQDERGAPRCKKSAVFTDVKCTLTPESAISIGKEDFHIYASCFRTDNNKRVPVPISNVQAKVYRKLFRKITPSLPPIAFGDNGDNGDKKKGDMVYTWRVRPTGSDWGYMFLEFDATIEGAKHNQRTTWFSTPHRVAEFQPGIQDRLEGGHLIVTVPVRVIKAGYYEIEANLQQKDGDQRYVATSTFEGDLEPGPQNVKLKFFGKIIRDKNVDGPFIVKTIRGKRLNMPMTPTMLLKISKEGGQIPATVKNTEPELEYFGFAPEHTTAGYKADEFSDKEWQSAAKTERIKYLQDLATGGK